MSDDFQVDLVLNFKGNTSLKLLTSFFIIGIKYQKHRFSCRFYEYSFNNELLDL